MINILSDTEALAIKRAFFPSFLVTPVNSLEEAQKRGSYDDISFSFTTLDQLELMPVVGEKRIYIVWFEEFMLSCEREVVELLKEYQLTFCKNSPNYLLGLSAQVLDKDIPEELRDKIFVAMEPENQKSLVLDDNQDAYPIAITNIGNYREKREIMHASGSRGLFYGRYAILAEEV